MFSKILKKLTKIETREKKQKENTVKPSRIGELGEYKINIQLDQLPKESRYLSDLLLSNPKAKSGYSQIDHVVFTSYGIFVIETKNYTGTIYGDRNREKWSINGKFTMINPFNQNYGHVQAIKSLLPSIKNENIISMISFTKRCTFKVNPELRMIQSNDLIVYDVELTEYITRKINVLKLQHRQAIFSNDELLQMNNKLQEENITDLNIREKHIELLKAKSNWKSNEAEQFENATCKACGKEVSEKVKVFCLSNKERFKGNVYCFEHQKNI
jgi:hypothetical protein